MKSRLLDVDHPYYCSESNYYSNEAAQYFETLTDFLDEFEDADEDMNLCFRWDIKFKNYEDSSEGYRGQVCLMLQRKGLFKPCNIETIDEEALPRFEKYLQKHWELLQKIWNPISLTSGKILIE